MTANFHKRQESALAATARLSALLAIILLGYVVVMHAIVALYACWFASFHKKDWFGFWNAYWYDYFLDPALFVFVAFALAVVVGGGWFFFVDQMKRYGVRGIAESFGGKLVGPHASTARERRLHNVVEEMALASGVPMPVVFMIDEPSINAVAFGWRSDEAGVAATRGALDFLARDELQAVMAHEFSHIKRGDMTLNIRVAGLVFGMKIVWLIARACIKGIGWLGAASAALPLLLILFFWIGCYLVPLAVGAGLASASGVFFGNLICAAVSRQREYLADASAVEFTRDPQALVGAFLKMGAQGTAVRSPGALRLANAFFADVSWEDLYASHPRLVDRIRAFDPSFNGVFPTVIFPNAWGDSPTANEMYCGFVGVADAVVHETAPTKEERAALLRPERFKVEVAPRLLEPIPYEIATLVRRPETAATLCCAFLASSDPEVRRAQRARVLSRDGERLGGYESESTARAYDLALAFADEAPFAVKLEVARRALPALQSSSKSERREFRAFALRLLSADGELDLFEYAFAATVLKELGLERKKRKIKRVKPSEFADKVAILLACVVSNADLTSDEARRAYDAALASINVDRMFPSERDRSPRAFMAALNATADLGENWRRQICQATWLCVSYNGFISEKGAAALSVVVAALGFPAPIWREWAKRPENLLAFDAIGKS